MIQAIHHVAMIVSSEESVSFYSRLGFQVTFRKTRQYDTVVLMEGYGIQLELFIDPNHPPKPNPEPLGLRHLALKVDNIENTLETLKLESDSIMNDWLGKRFCYVQGPDGQLIELHE